MISVVDLCVLLMSTVMDVVVTVWAGGEGAGITVS